MISMFDIFLLPSDFLVRKLKEKNDALITFQILVCEKYKKDYLFRIKYLCRLFCIIMKPQLF